MDRRNFLKFGAALGAAQGFNLFANDNPTGFNPNLGIMGKPHHIPKAKRVIYLYMAGGPSQYETFENKPIMTQMHGKELPKSVIGETRLTGMSGNQSSLPVAASPYKFKKYGQCGMEVSELLPILLKLSMTSHLLKPCTPRPSITARQIPSCKVAPKSLVALQLVLGLITVWGQTTQTYLHL